MGLSQANTILLFTIALICINQTLVSGTFFWKKCRVSFINDLQPSGNDLLLHCKSADDDLGLHKLAINHRIGWSFHPNFAETTLFHCGISWSRGNKRFTAFEDATSLLDDGCGGRNCTWKAKEDGLYLFNTNNHKFHFLYKWDTNVVNSGNPATKMGDGLGV